METKETPLAEKISSGFFIIIGIIVVIAFVMNFINIFSEWERSITSNAIELFGL